MIIKGLNKKGVESHILVFLIIGILVLIVVLGVVTYVFWPRIVEIGARIEEWLR